MAGLWPEVTVLYRDEPSIKRKHNESRERLTLISTSVYRNERHSMAELSEVAACPTQSFRG